MTAFFTMGLGCRRGALPTEMVELVDEALAMAGLTRSAIGSLATLEGKAAEPAIGVVARGLGLEVTTFSAARLEVETPRLLNPSEVVFRETGCHGVAEASALAAAGPEGRLVLPKRARNGCTIAIAVAGQASAGGQVPLA